MIREEFTVSAGSDGKVYIWFTHQEVEVQLDLTPEEAMQLAKGILRALALLVKDAAKSQGND